MGYRYVGDKTSADLVLLAPAEVGPDVQDESIRLAIAAGAEINLLASDAPTGLCEGATSRRRFLKPSAVAGIAIPVIASGTASRSAGAASRLPTCGEARSCNSDSDCGCNCNGDVNEGFCSDGVCTNPC